MKTIKVKTGEGDVEVKAVHVEGGLAVTRPPDAGSTRAGWNITHVASGLRLGHCTNPQLAREVLTRLLPLVDWTQDKETVLATPLLFERTKAVLDDGDDIGRTQAERVEVRPDPVVIAALDCACGHSWSNHKSTANGAAACSHHGCGCRDVVLPREDY